MGVGGREGEGECTFPINLFIFWTPIRAFTVFCMRPAETTTAFICLEAEAARRIVGMIVWVVVVWDWYWDLKIIGRDGWDDRDGKC